MNRRGFIGGLVASLAAPAIIRTPGLLMPVKPYVDEITYFIPAEIIYGRGLTYEMLCKITRDAVLPGLLGQIYKPYPMVEKLLSA